MVNSNISNIFNCMDYRAFLVHKLGGEGKRTGSKTKLALELDIKSSYLSRILKGDSDLTLEQAYRCCGFLKLESLEIRYFVELVSYSRAGTYDLKNLHKENLERLKLESEKIEKRLNEPDKLSEEDSMKYYSRWLYLAVHVAVSIPDLQTKESLQRKFDVEREELEPILDFLISSNIINFDEKLNKYSVGNTYTHIGSKSDLIFNHHYNWRLKSLEAITKNTEKNNLHYSGVFSLSKSDAEQLKENFIKLINQHVEAIKPSPEETMYCQVIDFFEV